MMRTFASLALVLAAVAPASANDESFSPWKAIPVTNTIRDCSYCPELVIVPKGTFTMGSAAKEGYDRERPQHEVTIPQDLAVGRFEVTWEDWKPCAEARACDHGSESGWGRHHRPVMNVTWAEAKAYVQWLSRVTGKNYRLLTEAEWEYVARAGVTTRYTKGRSLATHQATFDGGFGEKRPDKTTAVGRYDANKFGLHDVEGNVAEWTEDCWNPSYEGAPTDGSAWLTGECTHRVARGGAWDQQADDQRLASRWSYPADRPSRSIGLRVVRVH